MEEREDWRQTGKTVALTCTVVLAALYVVVQSLSLVPYVAYAGIVGYYLWGPTPLRSLQDVRELCVDTGRRVFAATVGRIIETAKPAPDEESRVEPTTPAR